MCLVGSTEGIGRLTAQFITYSFEIILWQDHVAVKYQEILA